MATTYFESAGTGQTAELLKMTQDAGTSTFVMTVARGTPQIATFKAPAANPGAGVSNTGTFTAKIELTAASDVTGNCALALNAIRYNSGGTAQATVAIGASQTITATGVKTFTVTSPALGTWAAGDFFGITATITNNNSTGTAKTFTVQMGGANDTVVAPWTYVPPTQLVVANAAHAQTAGAVTITQTVTTKENLFTTQTPATPSNVDATYTLGTAFRPAVNGKIIGARVWCAAALTGTLGGLYSYDSNIAGTLLASKTFGTLTAGGWTNVFFDTPVSVTAGTMYVAVWGKTTNYAVTSNFFTTSDLVNGNLTAPKASVGLDQGRFVVNASALAYPTGSFNDTNYFVDTIFVADVVAGTNLVVANSTQAQTAESPTLVRNISLTVANATQAETAASLALTQVHSLTIGNATQAESVGSPTLVRNIGLTVANATQAETAAAPTLTQLHSLAIGNASQLETAASPALTQVHSLAVANAAQAETATSPTLALTIQLTVQNATQTETAGSPTLVQSIGLTVANATQAETAGSPTLVRNISLTVANATQAETVGSPTLVRNISLTVQNASQAQTSGSALITLTTGLVVQGATQAEAATSPVLTQVHSLAVQGANQGQTVGSPVLARIHNLLPQTVNQAQSAGSPALTQLHVLATQSAQQNQVVGNVVLIVGGITLTIANARHAQTAGSVALTQVHVLAVQNANQAQSSGSPALTQVHILAVQNANQAQSAGSPTLTQLHVLAVQNSKQNQAVGNVVLTQVHILAAQSVNQLQNSGSASLTQVHVLAVESVNQSQEVETPDLVQVHFLSVQEAIQEQAAGNVVLGEDVKLVVAGAYQALRADTVTLIMRIAPTAKERRLKIQALLEELLGTGNVYYQPPPNVMMQYPCIVYTRSFEKSQFAANVPYIVTKRYTVTVIDRDPDSSIPDKVAALPMSSFQRFFTADNLNHDVFDLYF